jgi:hypothetical protein
LIFTTALVGSAGANETISEDVDSTASVTEAVARRVLLETISVNIDVEFSDVLPATPDSILDDNPALMPEMMIHSVLYTGVLCEQDHAKDSPPLESNSWLESKLFEASNFQEL